MIILFPLVARLPNVDIFYLYLGYCCYLFVGFSRRSSSGSRRFNKRSSSGNHSLRRQRTVSKEPVLPPIDEISGASTAGYIVDKISTVLRYNVTSLDPFLADLVKICGSKLYVHIALTNI